jgi:CheY-like chemotaxis protein
MKQFAILLVAWDPTLNGLLSEVLGEAGYQVRALAAPDLTPQRLAQGRPDLILLDGLAATQPGDWLLVQALRTHPATALIPLVVCTTAHQRAAALAPDLARYRVPVVLQPFNLDDLLTTVAQALACPGYEWRGARGAWRVASAEWRSLAWPATTVSLSAAKDLVPGLSPLTGQPTCANAPAASVTGARRKARGGITPPARILAPALPER